METDKFRDANKRLRLNNIHTPKIDRSICTAMLKFIENTKEKFPETCLDGEVRRSGENEFEIYFKINGNKDLIRFIEVDIFRKRPMVVVPSIVTPKELQRNGIGKKILFDLFKAATEESHYFLVVDLVPSFKRRLLARGAHEIGEDQVQITDKTDLLTPVIPAKQ